MTTALYRRYRPEAFGEMIGQAQVTEPLMAALRGDRVGHAYLFSGPRGCGKTTSARILARCLNCAEGPTDTPCGRCDSCVELSRGGGGSLDVVEIDAASHNGVDDARDLRERAVFAPARDRFKIFILDEAHMVTAQGFNALLKLVEEPPPHVKFIFATTEPEKVLGTIRSRTHHYPFRLVAPAAMLAYVEQLCGSEGVQVEPGVLPLVVRAGGGSPRDTLSLLDQLIAGSESGTVTYARSVALLGYTHAELLDEVVDAFRAGDAGAAFAATDRVVQTGQDPRRFVDDLLERLRDLIVIAATGDGASSVLRGIPADELERMGRQAVAFGPERLSRIADLVVGALDDMTGATSPRLQLELLVARVLAHGGAGADAGAVAPPSAAPVVPQATPVAPRAEGETERSPVPPAPPASAGPVTLDRVREAWPRILDRVEPLSRSSWMLATVARAVDYTPADVLTLAFGSPGDVAAFKKLAAGKGPSADLRAAIADVLGVQVKFLARHEPEAPPEPPHDPGPEWPDEPPPDWPDDPRAREAAPAFPPQAPPQGGPERSASPPRTASPRAETPSRPPAPRPSAAAPVTEWAVAPIPHGDAVPPSDAAPGVARTAAAPPQAAEPSAPPALAAPLAVDDEPEEAASAPLPTATLVREAPRDGDVLAETSVQDDDDVPAPVADAPIPPRIAPPASTPRTPRAPGIERVGEAVVRQLLGATFVREEPYNAPTRFN